MLNAQSHRKPNLDNLIHFLIFSLVSLLIVWSPSFQCNFCHFHWNQKPISISTAIGILNQCWYINTLIYWYTDILIYWYIDILMNWYSGQSCSKKAVQLSSWPTFSRETGRTATNWGWVSICPLTSESWGSSNVLREMARLSRVFVTACPALWY